MPDYEVQQGDCISSISAESGFLPDTIWNHAKNFALKQKRKDPNVLFPGDIVFIPEKEIKEIASATDQQHKFQLKSAPAKLRLRLLRDNKPRANEKYQLTIEGRLFEGTTDGDGWIEQAIPPSAQDGTLRLPDAGEEYDLHLGCMDPIDEVSGVMARLQSLGFTGDGEMPRALGAFQKNKKLPVTGNLDQATKDALKAAYGS
jgi:Putative peptidoglycan binding domain